MECLNINNNRITINLMLDSQNKDAFSIGDKVE